MRASTLCLALLSVPSASAFLAPRALMPSTKATARPHIMAMQASSSELADADLSAGVSAPLGYFDPLGFSKNLQPAELKKYRESELKHGRVAMLAALGFLVQEKFHPLFGFGSQDMGQALRHFQEIQGVAPYFWAGLVFAVGLTESINIAKGWQPRSEVPQGGIALLRDDYVTGDLGLDPFDVAKDPATFKDMRTKELNNGRLAMLAVLAMVVQEGLVSSQTLFQQASTYLTH